MRPNQQRPLNELPLLSSGAVNKHRLSIQVGARRAKTCTQCAHIPTERPFLPATLAGWGWLQQTHPPLPSGLAKPGPTVVPETTTPCLPGTASVPADQLASKVESSNQITILLFLFYANVLVAFLFFSSLLSLFFHRLMYISSRTGYNLPVVGTKVPMPNQTPARHELRLV